MFENIINFFKRFGKNEKGNSKEAAKERLHLVLAQDRANISADFLEMMKQEIIEVIKKYIDIDEEAIDVRMTNKPGEDGIVGAPALYANIPIVTIKNEARKLEEINKVEAKEKINEEKSSDELDEEENPKVEDVEKTEDKDGTVIEKNNEEKQEVKQNKENSKTEEKSSNVEIKSVEDKNVEPKKKANKETAKGNNNKPTSNHNNKKQKRKDK